MIKRRFYKQDHGDRNEVSDSSSSSSGSDSEADEAAQEERDQTEEEEEEVEEEVGEEAAAEARQEERQCSLSPGSGYESEDSSGNELDCDPSGLLIDDNEEESNCWRRHINNSLLPGKGKTEAGEGSLSNIPEKKDSMQAEFSDYVLKCKSVFKCRLCPRIVCLTEDSLISHLKSKRHARSKKLFGEGRLKLMLNSDGEIEEDQETHAERHARTLALAQESTNKKKSKNKGRQRQRLRLKRKKTGNGHDEDKGKQLMKSPSKKRRRNED